MGKQEGEGAVRASAMRRGCSRGGRWVPRVGFLGYVGGTYESITLFLLPAAAVGQGTCNQLPPLGKSWQPSGTLVFLGSAAG